MCESVPGPCAPMWGITCMTSTQYNRWVRIVAGGGPCRVLKGKECEKR